MDIIYCAGGNKPLMEIAHEAGYLIGIRSGYLDYGFPISFVDIHYKEPDFARHLEVVKMHQPKYAIVPDLITHYAHKFASQFKRSADGL